MKRIKPVDVPRIVDGIKSDFMSEAACLGRCKNPNFAPELWDALAAEIKKIKSTK